MSHGRPLLAALLSPLLAVAMWRGATAEVSRRQLDEALGKLRRIQPEKLSETEQEQKAKEVEQAWATIEAAGEAGIERLKQEVAAVDKEKARDDFFKLNACALLWKLKGLDEAEYIAEVWRATPVDAQYSYVFYTAFEAAKTQDGRAVPMLLAGLRDDKGEVFVEQHFLRIKWPLTHEFLWGVLGPKGFPALIRILDRSTHPVELQSALLLLTPSADLGALARVRQLARKSDHADVRHLAIRCLGEYGHPEDYKFLEAGLASPDPEEAWQFAYALYEYGDLRAVPALVKLLKAGDADLRQEVIAALRHLLAPEGLEALEAHSRKARDRDEMRECGKIVGKVLGELRMTWSAYAEETPEEKAALLAAIRQKAEDQFTLEEADRRLSREGFLEAAAAWKKQHRFPGAGYEWVKAKHVLAIATPQDLGLLREVKAALYLRLSDECLYEVRTLNTILGRLGRTRYRQHVGVCERVMPKY